MKRPTNKIFVSSVTIFALVLMLWGISARPAVASAPLQAVVTITLTATGTPTPGPSPSPTLAMTNRAYHKSTTSSTPCNADETSAKAVDGLMSTLVDKWCSADATKWWQVDLGATYPIQEIVIVHAQGGGEGVTSALNTRDFEIQASFNGVSWRTIATVTGNKYEVTTHYTILLKARYIRINVITGAQPGQDNIARIYEVYVMGYGS